MNHINLDRLRKLAENTLSVLVTEERIFASTPKGVEGMYYATFGRDTGKTALLIYEAEKMIGKKKYTDSAIASVIKLASWQGKADNPQTGEEKGKIPHEIRTDSQYYIHLTIEKVRREEKPWFVDKDGVLKNWDSADATPLWISSICDFINGGALKETGVLNSHLKAALKWCLKNIERFGGFAAFQYDENRKWGGLRNQGWKDSARAYLLPNGEIPRHPLKTVYVNALFWKALQVGAQYFSGKDSVFSSKLKTTADQLKQNFNSETEGFLMRGEKSDYYFAEAIDGDGNQLTQIACDAGLALWPYIGKECVIEKKYISPVVSRLMMNDMFDPAAGIRTYSNDPGVFDPYGYHRGPNTFWPFVSACIASGMHQFGYSSEARQILSAMLAGISRFESCIEMFVKANKDYVSYMNPETKQVSAVDQAWTAAAVYFATCYFATQLDN